MSLPGWEALKESTQGSSSNDESEEYPIRLSQIAERPVQHLKRKDNDRAPVSVAKRPRHDVERLEGRNMEGGSASAPGPSSGSRPSSSQAGPSRLSSNIADSNATSISARPSTAPKTDASQETSTYPKPRPKPPRSKYQHIAVFSSPEAEGNNDSGHTRAGTSIARKSFFGPANGKKPASEDNEIIEISSDSEPPSRSKPSKPLKPNKTPKTSKPISKMSKPSSKAKPIPRATMKTNKPQNAKKGSPEIIIITDSDDGLAAPPTQGTDVVVKVQEGKRSVSPSLARLVQQELSTDEVEMADEPVVNCAMDADMEVDEVEQNPQADVTRPSTSTVSTVTSAVHDNPSVSNISTVPPRASNVAMSTAPSAPSFTSTSVRHINAITTPLQPATSLPFTPLQNSAPSSKPPSSGRVSTSSQLSAKRPVFNRSSLQTPSPASPLHGAHSAPMPPRKFQSGIKTASLTKRPSPSSSSRDESGSEESSVDTGPGVASAPKGGIDMRNLSEALDVAVPSAMAPEAEPAVPHIRPSHVTSSPMARKSTGGRAPPKLSTQTARKTISGRITTTLAEAIMSAGQINASHKHQKKRSSISSIHDLNMDRKQGDHLQHVKNVGTSSKIDKLPFTHGKTTAAGPSSLSSAISTVDQSPPARSRSGTDELILRPSEPSPPASPSPPIPEIEQPSSNLSTANTTLLPSTTRRRSAPALGEALTLTTAAQVRPSASVVQNRKTLTNGSSLAGSSVQIRPFSMDSVPLSSKACLSPEKLKSQASPLASSPGSPLVLPSIPSHPRYHSPPVPSSLPESPHEPYAPQTSVLASEPVVPATTPSPRSSKSAQAAVSPSSYITIPTTNASPEMATQSETDVIPAPHDDTEMGASSEERSSLAPPQSEYSDDEAMEDAAEVEALIDEDHMDFETQEFDAIEGVDDDELLLLNNMTRHPSRVSSGSSASEKWPLSFDSRDASRQTTPEDGVIVPHVHHGKQYGGLEAITWPDHVKNAKNLPPKCALAIDIPHVFEDHVNNMTRHTRMLPEMRKVYEARILENTVEDEPDAPPIEIQNDVDDEATPPWEFFYSNKMWHGEGVPLPDTKSLVRCNCKGVCNPKSKTCACLQRQKEACQDPSVEFAYDKTGKLKIPGYPIFECNDFCGCGDECRNRVVQHGRKVSVAIRKTAKKGWGVFSTKKILAGSFIGIYAGELITDFVAQKRGAKYNKFGRTYLFDIDFHHLKDSSDSNWTNQFTVDAYHAGNFTRFLNHSCDPNSRLFACYINEGNIQKPLLVIFSLRDIEPNEEVCFNYTGNYPGEEDDDDDDDDDDNEPLDGGETKDLIYGRCRCDAYNCTGVMFK